MLFNSINFVFLFLPITLIAFYGCKPFLRPSFAVNAPFLVIVCASLIFYSHWFWPNVFVLCFSILLNFYIGKIFQKVHHRKLCLFLGISFNLLLLAYFKYFNFFVENVTALFGNNNFLITVALPLGISFFTFQQIAYLVEGYRGKIRAESLLEYALFVSFFPQLIAGPIVLYEDLRKQYRGRRFGIFDLNMLVGGISIFAIGLSKKILIADQLSSVSDRVFARADAGLTIQFFEAWAGALAYTYQLYFDFSGYSDMAIGLALMFGLYLPINFTSPYKATSIIEFWRRWHVTLSNFLRDYLYIPLGGGKKGYYRTMLNLLIVMLLGGLWHGAGWNFVFWGFLHGVFLLVNHTYRRYGLLFSNVFSATPVAYLLTMISVILAWTFFRAESFQGALNIIDVMFGGNLILMPSELYPFIPEVMHSVLLKESEKDLLYWCGDLTWDVFLIIIIVALGTVGLPSSTDLYKSYRQSGDMFVASRRLSFAFLLGTAFVLSILLIYAESANKFLYFQF